jgi:hypothetical protein
MENKTKELKDYIEHIVGFKCSVRNIKKGSMKGHYIIAPLSLEDGMWKFKEEFERLGFTFCSNQSIHLPYTKATIATAEKIRKAYARL